jgi:MFS family permease
MAIEKESKKTAKDNTTDRALGYSIIDGAFSAVMGSLAGGIFLAGFAIKVLNAQAGQIGVLASLPMLANLVQVFGSYIIERTGKKKILCCICVLASRLLWVLILLLPLEIFGRAGDWRIWVLVGVIGLSSLFGSLSGVAWLAWMSDIVPENIRGSYFGKRNMIASAFGMVAILAGGRFLSFWGNRFSEDSPFGFIIIFAIGLLSGIIATLFLFKIPETEAEEKKANAENGLTVLLKPLKDKNFVKLIIFASAWIFAIQLAAPFYGVFMIDNLNIDFTTITVFGTVATFATLFMMKVWGPISDKLGNKPVIIVSGGVLALVPFIWIMALPGDFYMPILIAHALSGAFMAGAALSQFNIMIKLSPKQGRSAYIALFAAISGTAGAIAPIIGGLIASMFGKLGLAFFSYNISNLHIIFMVSGILQAVTFLFIVKINEPSAASPVAVIMQLKNDLNPQAGISSGTDFMMIELKRTGGIFKKIDSATDSLADKCHNKISGSVDTAADIFKKSLKKIKNFFNWLDR